MNQLEKRGYIFGLVALILAFFLFSTGCIIIKPKPRIIYKTIQIQLANPVPPQKEIVKKEEKKSEQIQKKSESVQPEKEIQKTQTKPVQPEVQASKTEQKNTASVSKNSVSGNVPAKTVQRTIKKSVEDLMAEQSVPSKKQSTWDDSEFDDFDEETEVQIAQVQSVAKSSLSGQAASSASENSNLVSSSSSTAKSQTQVSDATANALSQIQNNSFSSTVTDGVKSQTSISSARNSKGTLEIKMDNGILRELRSPKNPSIYISEENAALIDSTRSVKIIFAINADGSVPLSKISIRPQSALPVEIQNEIKEQIRHWQFTPDPSQEEGTASFDYSIVLR